MIPLFTFFAGMIFGVLLFAIIVGWQVRKAEQELAKQVAQAKIKNRKAQKTQEDEDIKSLEAIIDQIHSLREIHKSFDEITKISEEQASIMGALERPNASASHSKHKRSLIMRMRDLEEKKLNLFDSILKHGVDPVVVVLDDNGKQTEMPMSEVAKLHRADLEQFDNGGMTDSKNPRGNVSHLTLVKDEEFDDDDGEDTTGNPTLH